MPTQLVKSIIIPTKPSLTLSFTTPKLAYGIRNVPRIEKALSEAHRVLKKGGRIMILEFSKVE